MRPDTGVFALSWILLDDIDIDEEGLPATERRPEDNENVVDWGDNDAVDELVEGGIIRCCDGSFARIASAKARDISSGGDGSTWYTVELERDLPGAGIPLLFRPGVGRPEGRGLAGVVIRVLLSGNECNPSWFPSNTE